MVQVPGHFKRKGDSGGTKRGEKEMRRVGGGGEGMKKETLRGENRGRTKRRRNYFLND